MKGIIWWNIGSSSSDPATGFIGREIPTIGIRAWVERDVLPLLDWAGPYVGVQLHNPFGRWEPKMHYSQYEYAERNNCGWLTLGFQAAMEAITRRVDCIAYIGNATNSLDVHPSQASLRRNLQPYFDAGMDVVVDHTLDALDGPDAEMLAIIDRHGVARAGIEASPMRDATHYDLHWRRAFMSEWFFQSHHGPQAWPDIADKWGEPSYLTGTIHRLLHKPEYAAELPTHCAAIRADGHVPLVSANLIDRARHTPEELFG